MRKITILFILALLVALAIAPAYSANEGTISVTDDNGATRIVMITAIADIMDDGDSTCTIKLLNGDTVTSDTTQAAVRTLIATAWSVSASSLTYSGTVQAEQLTSTDDATVTDDLDVGGKINSGSGNHDLTNDAGLIDGEKIQDDTIDDDSIDFADVTGADLTLTDVTALTCSSTATFNGNVVVQTTDTFTYGAVRWDDGSDAIQGESIADDTIDDDSIDFTDVTGADITGTDFAELATPVQNVTLGAAATTIAITSNFIQLTGDAGANTVATITGASSGQILVIECVDGLVTFTDTDAHTSNTIDLTGTATNQVSADDLIIMLIYDGTSWYQIGESQN